MSKVGRKTRVDSVPARIISVLNTEDGEGLTPAKISHLTDVLHPYKALRGLLADGLVTKKFMAPSLWWKRTKSGTGQAVHGGKNGRNA